MDKPKNDIKLYKYCPHCASNLVLKKDGKETIKKCNKCGFIFWNNPKPAVSILLYQDGKVFMLQRANEPLKDYWILPGGFIGYEETTEEAIKRETKEEIGVNIIIDGLIGVYRIDNDPREIHIDIVFYGKAKGQIKLSQENNKWQNFSLQTLPKNIAYKHKKAIFDWHNNQD